MKSAFPVCGGGEEGRGMRGRTDMVIPFLEIVVEIVDLVVVFEVIDVEFEGVDADDGS